MMQVNWKVLAALMLGGTVVLTGCSDDAGPVVAPDTNTPDVDSDTDGGTDPDTEDVTDAGDTDPADVTDAGDTDPGDVTDAGDTDAGDVSDAGDTSGPVCGNGTIEGDEQCDDGLDNDDRLPNACRTSCELPACGDNVTDDGEQCDDGDANAVDAACSDVCEINLDVACADVDLLDASLDGTVVAGTVVINGVLASGVGASAPPIDCGTGIGGGSEVVVAWTPTVAGAYRISTDNTDTLADTTLYLADSCVDGTPSACNTGAELGVGGTLLVNDIEAGFPYFIVVDSDDLVGGAFTLTISPIAGIAAEGESCVTATCEVGLACTEGVCEVPLGDVAPTLTSLTATAVLPTAVRYAFAGTDPNEDVNNVTIERITFANGDVYGDEPDEGVLNLTNDVIPDWLDGAFTFDVILNLGGLATPPGTAVTSVTMGVIDASGLESNTLVATVPAYVEPPVVGEGADCDIEGFTSTCEAPFVCGYTPTGDTICGDSVAPVIDSVTAEWLGANTVNHTITGTDPNNDLVDGLATLYFDGGPFDLNFGFDTLEYDGENFVAEVAITGIGTFEVTDTDFVVNDFDGNVSNVVNVVYVTPTLIGAGGACGEGVTGVCQPGLLCSPVSGGRTACVADSAPVLSRLEGFYLAGPENIVQFNLDGSDLNGDVVTVQIRLLITDGGELFSTDLIDLPASDFTPDPAGRATFRITSPELPTGPNLFFEIEASLIDASGNQSGTLTDALGTEGAIGAACTPGTLTACADGLTCGEANTCETPVAPVLTSAEIARFVVEEIELTLDGTDANGDVEFVVVRAFDLDGEPLADVDGVVLEFEFPFETSVRGLTTFSATSIFGVDDIIASIEFELLDDAGLRSNTLSLDLPVVVDVDGACSGDPTVDVCTAPSACVAGTCSVDSAEPCGAGIAVGNLNTLLTETDGVFSGTFTLPATGNTIELACEFATFAGDGPELYFTWTAPQTGLAEFSTTNSATGLDTQIFVNEGTCLFTAGESCNDDAGSLLSSLAVSVVAGTEYFVLIDSFAGGTNNIAELQVEYLEANSCDAPAALNFDSEFNDYSGTAAFSTGSDTLEAPLGCTESSGGTELIFEWTAPSTGVYDALVVAPDFDSVLWVSSGTCGGTSLACNDDSADFDINFLSSVVVNATAGTTYYFVVESYDGEAVATPVTLIVLPPG